MSSKSRLLFERATDELSSLDGAPFFGASRPPASLSGWSVKAMTLPCAAVPCPSFTLLYVPPPAVREHLFISHRIRRSALIVHPEPSAAIAAPHFEFEFCFAGGRTLNGRMTGALPASSQMFAGI